MLLRNKSTISQCLVIFQTIDPIQAIGAIECQLQRIDFRFPFKPPIWTAKPWSYWLALVKWSSDQPPKRLPKAHSSELRPTSGRLAAPRYFLRVSTLSKYAKKISAQSCF